MKRDIDSVKLDYQIYLDSKPEDVLPFGIWCLVNANPEKLRRSAQSNIERNRALFAEEAKYVSEGGHKVLANPEYEANAKKLREYQHRKRYGRGYEEFQQKIIREAALKRDAPKKESWLKRCLRKTFPWLFEHKQSGDPLPPSMSVMEIRKLREKHK